MNSIDYKINQPITSEQFIEVLKSSGLAERRPVDDMACIKDMLEYANLSLTAWDGEKLVGVARSVTDFSYCCYLSDLAVDKGYQHQGIGKALIYKTREQLGEKCSLILLSAPAAVNYYPRVGMQQHPSAWILRPED